MIISEIQGRHESEKQNCNVKGLRVDEMTTKFLPHNLCEHFPRLEAIEVVGGKLSRLEKRDIKHYVNLKILWLPRNNIETLRKDAFESNQKLEKISFYGNRLRFIESEAFRGLKSLKFISLDLNDCIDRCAWNKFDKIFKEINENCKEI
jgi:hypothetical protein